MDKIGQCYRMMKTPAEALTEKKELFETPEVYEEVFRDRDPENYLFPYLCHEYYWGFWHAKRFPRIREVCTDSLDDARLRRLIKAKGQVVSHSVGLSCWLFQSGEEWSRSDARSAYGTFESENPNLDAWTRHIGIAFFSLLQLLEGINKERRNQGLEDITVKKHLERIKQEAFRDLQASISNFAEVLFGKNWKRQIIKKIRP